MNNVESMAIDQGAIFRKYQKNVEISGRAIISFGVWSIIKFVVSVLLGQETLWEILGVDPSYPENLTIYLVVILVILLAITLYWHFYLGISAIKYSRGKKKSRVFLFWALVMLVVTLVSIPSYFNFEDNNSSLDTVIVSALVDITMCFSLADMIFSSFKMAGIRKHQDQGKELSQADQEINPSTSQSDGKE